MRDPAMILALAGALLLTGCSSMVSLEPFVTDDVAVTDPSLVGLWQDSGDGDKNLMAIRQKGSAYSIRYFGEDKDFSWGFEGRLLRVGDAELMDFVSTSDNTFNLPVHMVARIWTDGGVLKWAYLDSGWIKDKAQQTLGTQAAGERTLIAVKGAALVEFLKKYGADEKACGDKTQELIRVQ